MESMKILEEAYAYVSSRMTQKPDVALVLGSGLGGFTSRLSDSTYIDYKDIPGFPVSTVSGHNGRFVFGSIGNTSLVVMEGRVHYYEGYSMEQVILPIRLMHRMGADTLILTNAAGGINSSFEPGDLMLLTDQIASFVPSPLRGPNAESLGTRFPDMSRIYDERLIQVMEGVALKFNIDLKHGVYLQTQGPNYESPAEIKMFKLLGADAVGMSTAVEAIAARHMGMRVAGVSCITNMASGLSDRPLNHIEVKDAADKASARFTTLIENFCLSI